MPGALPLPKTRIAHAKPATPQFRGDWRGDSTRTRGSSVRQACATHRSLVESEHQPAGIQPPFAHISHTNSSIIRNKCGFRLAANPFVFRRIEQ